MVVVQWKKRTNRLIEVFSNLLLFTKSYPKYNYNTLNNYLSKAKTVYENEEVRIERKQVLTQPIPTPAAQTSFRMERVIRKTTVHGYDEKTEDLSYWLSRPATERLAAVTFISMGAAGWKRKMDRTVIQISKMKHDGIE